MVVTEYGQRQVVLDAARVAAEPPGARLRLEAPGSGQGYAAIIERHEHSANGSLVLIGRIETDGEDGSSGENEQAAHYRLVISSNEGYSFGHIETPEGKLHLRTEDSGVAVLSHGELGSLQAVRGEEACKLMAPERQDAELSWLAGMTEKLGSGPETTVVDLLVVHNTQFVTRLGRAGANARLDFLLALGNQAFIDSGVAIRLREAARVERPWRNTTSNAEMLEVIGSDRELATLRDQHGADIVILVRPFNRSFHDGCGVAWLGAYQGGPFRASHAFAVTSDGTSEDGSRWFCDDTTFIHEIGHVFGLSHDWGQPDAGQGAYPYANGYGIDNVFGTVMSYLSPPLTRFSDPRQLCEGMRCGVPMNEFRPADAVTALDLTRHAVGAFRPSAIQENLPPEVSAGRSFSAFSGEQVLLQGSARDPDGRVVGVQWRQLSGTAVRLRNADTLSATFTAPQQAGVLVFELSVSDDQGAQAQARVSVEVVELPPDPRPPLPSDADFIEQLHEDFLLRSSQSNEAASLLRQVRNGSLSWAEVVDVLFNMEEFQTPLAGLIRLYQAYFDRAPEFGGLQFWRRRLQPALAGRPPMAYIIGGGPAAADEWSGLLALEEISTPGGSAMQRCAANLIDRNWALTAAHCLSSTQRAGELEGLQLRAGSLRLHEGGSVAKVARAIVHPEFDPASLRYDLALLQLEQALDHPRAQLLLPELEDTLAAPGQVAAIAGWGRTEVAGERSTVLQSAWVPLVSREQCASSHASASVDDSMLCAGFDAGGVDSCQGDSGGPLYVADPLGRWYLAGITSWGEGCALAGRPGVYARVSTALPWLQAELASDFSAGAMAASTGQGMSLVEVASEFAASNEFRQRYGALDNEGFVTLVYRNVLERDPDPIGRVYWLNKLASGMSRGEVMLGFSDSFEYIASQQARNTVIMLYAALLQRIPAVDELPPWLGRVTERSGRLELIESILNSDEYRRRF
ncbi:MAG: trypsin-like serine protease [Thauera sp.]|nr:trypsin-like serine protease [Thauera sp.]